MAVFRALWVVLYPNHQSGPYSVFFKVDIFVDIGQNELLISFFIMPRGRTPLVQYMSDSNWLKEMKEASIFASGFCGTMTNVILHEFRKLVATRTHVHSDIQFHISPKDKGS